MRGCRDPRRSDAVVINLHCGDLDRAMEFLQRVLRLGSADPGIRFALTEITHIHILRGNFSRALDFATRSLAVNDRFDSNYWILIAAHAYLGQRHQAVAWLRSLLAIAPDVRISRILASQLQRYPERFDAIADLLRKAGFPE